MPHLFFYARSDARSRQLHVSLDRLCSERIIYATIKYGSTIGRD